MKLLILLMGIVLVGAPSLVQSQAINNALRNQIENLRSQMPCGFGDGPPLAPFQHDNLDINVNSDVFVAHGYLRNIFIAYLDRFIINDINFSILQMRIDFSFLFNEIMGNGQYYLDSRIMDWVRLFGNGPFNVQLFDLDITGFLRFTVRGGFLDMDEFNATVSLRDIRSEFYGALGGGAVSDLVNRVIEEFIKEFIKLYQPEISQAISDIIRPPANAVLNQMTMTDLLALINSEPGAGSEPCIPPITYYGGKDQNHY